ncbi:MAG: phosphocholine cytidylyltransferase family protein [Acidobacteriota bacterium]|nr:phosphocholine cytidylyltransferase family protein [Acidobacteriota bacterium]MDW3229249.1 phosphocholine cytidylyltransferase family protein [Acidobacteriota bacterium]
MKGLIIAAGRGKRLSNIFPSKPLLPIAQQPLIDWVVKALIRAGIKDIVVVTGYQSDQVEDHLKNQVYPEEISFNFVLNEEWQKENGLSVYKAQPFLGQPFFLLMADHIFDPSILIELKKAELKNGQLILAVDSKIDSHPYVDLEDVTRVRIQDGFIVDIGKGLTDYNAFDTGIFYCSPAIFQALEESQRLFQNFSLSGGVKRLAARGQARALEVANRFWIDVDDENALGKAEAFLKTGGSWLEGVGQ